MYGSFNLIVAFVALFKFTHSHSHPEINTPGVSPPIPLDLYASSVQGATLNYTLEKQVSPISRSERSTSNGANAQACVRIDPFKSFAHEFKTAESYIWNKRQILIKQVYYDGFGPDAFWIVSNSDKFIQEYPRERPNPKEYTKIPDETGSTRKLEKYEGKDVLLTLPETISFTDLKYISMYCVRFNHNFGYVQLPKPISVPDYDPAAQSPKCDQSVLDKNDTKQTQPVVVPEPSSYSLGKFTPFPTHNFSTAETTLLNEKQVFIQNVVYDGLGPQAYWIVSNSDRLLQERPKLKSADYTVIPDETGSCGVLKAYTGQNVTLTLPENLKFTQLKYISMYCIRYDHNFGYIRIPESTAVPDYSGSVAKECNPLEKKTSILTIVFIVLGSLCALIGGVAALYLIITCSKQSTYSRH